MTRFSTRAISLAAAMTLLVAVFVGNAAKADSKANTRADYLAMTGSELYSRFCASCHGVTGRGDGPVAKSFAVEVPDLTLIARRRSGKFPSDLIEKVIDGRYIIGAHGTREMPIWGEEFMRTELGNPDADRTTALIVQKLVEHVRSIQRPVAAPAAKSD